jgi:glutamate synthase domain-containing protein 1
MCGIVGLLLRDRELETRLGKLLVPMIEALDERGPDSSGIAVYAEPPPAGNGEAVLGAAAAPLVRLSLGADVAVDWIAVGCALLDLPGTGADLQRLGAGLLVDVPHGALAQALALLAEEWPQVRVLGTGTNVRVLKDTGRPTDTCARYGIGCWEGYLAVAHTRMATESAVTVLHSHPFVPARDLCVVHNGSFSNYATVRRRLENEGVCFDSDNDSEVAARYLASRLEFGDDIEEATRWVMKEMDGFFTLVITTADAMSLVRDAFGCKPAVVAETAGYVAVASEYRALAELPGISDALVFEPHPEEVYTWRR